MLGTVPRPTDTDPEWNNQEWHSAGVKFKVRPQNFERTLQILRTCVALKWSPGFLYLWEGLLIDVPQNPDSDLLLQKGPIVLLHSSKGLSSCPPSIPGPHYFKWAWNCFKWTMAANFFIVLSKGAWVIRLDSSLWRERSPAVRNGISYPINKMLGCGLLAHCGDRRTINSVMVFMPLGQGGCPTLNLTASENMFPSQKASPAFFFFTFLFFF